MVQSMTSSTRTKVGTSVPIQESVEAEEGFPIMVSITGLPASGVPAVLALIPNEDTLNEGAVSANVK